MRIAIFPGSFDPMHEGHIDIIKRASKLFDQLIVTISINTSKQHQTSLNERYTKVLEQVNQLGLDNVCVKINNGLTVEFAKKNKANYIVRSFRDNNDIEYEMTIASANYYLDKTIETILFAAEKDLKSKSSSSIKKMQQEIAILKNKK
ncbi:phosphopantetheine adenylyltransferase [Candidatus Malacoplasma girerdii]|uniref:Phosphopantetheine adenylyltransferase n=1 Tax=Candidatus Malacoplasma girerdii TaxID=1318617 RepID=A0A097SS45_9BACT|nr:phosphopantetheine adenylyltransferase [Candidatus Malacoplasma girerdii]